MKTLIPVLAALCLLACVAPAAAQSLSTLPRVAILHVGSPESDKQERAAFAEGLRKQGYSDGKNMVLDESYIAGRNDKLPEIIREILARKPAVLVVGGSQSVHAARGATRTVPIVVYSMADPVGQGIVQSLAHPGGNITGIAILSEILIAKRLEILTETLPAARKIGHLSNPQNPMASALAGYASAAAKKAGVELVVLSASSASELQQVLKGLTRKNVDALLLGQDATLIVHRDLILKALAASRVPAMHGFSLLAEEGGLMSYSARIAAASRQASWAAF